VTAAIGRQNVALVSVTSPVSSLMFGDLAAFDNRTGSASETAVVVKIVSPKASPLINGLVVPGGRVRARAMEEAGSTWSARRPPGRGRTTLTPVTVGAD
jgi:hypothetical protein